ncbi:MAG: hypothetical protein II477_12625 [Lachnospiraceae bacterium]|nr:hypothetical protein [Lachnospiraceae bacterium]MBQ2101894.1 hypothetical protein [Lachnospiraceae bacterium]MBQ3906152.1 hypothetical protein [Lachnospiraceae bacterium]
MAKPMNVSSNGLGISEALQATEQIALEAGLEKKETLHLRLLAEELFGMLRSVVGDLEAQYTCDAQGKSFALHMKGTVSMTVETKENLIALSASGQNAAAKGFMGKIRDMIATALLPTNEGPSLLAMGLMSMGSPTGYRVGSGGYEWSMLQYKTGVEGKAAEDDGAQIACDELEKSIVANIADDVKVSVKGSDVEIIVYKAFS